MAAPAIAKEISSREQLLFLKSRVTLRGLRFFINFDLLLKSNHQDTRSASIIVDGESTTENVGKQGEGENEGRCVPFVRKTNVVARRDALATTSCDNTRRNKVARVGSISFSVRGSAALRATTTILWIVRSPGYVTRPLRNMVIKRSF